MSSNPFVGPRAALALLAVLPLAACQSAKSSEGAVPADAPAPRVEVTPNEAQQRVDVTVDGQPFTSYIWPNTVKKPVLYPLRTASGLEITRGWPEARPGERVDHPHHVGLWFNHSDVNNLDFWNNSDAIPASQANRMGSIVQKSIEKAEGGDGLGELVTTSDWVRPDGKVLIHERTEYVFHAAPHLRGIDRITTLTATDSTVTFEDNKDGTLGLRVRRELEQPSEEGGEFVDGEGRVTKVAKMDNTGVTGHYLNAEGVGGDSVWSSRSKWSELKGEVKGEPVTIAIFDHPSNYNFPTYWHARGYGLYAANPFGAKDFTKGKQIDNFKLEPGKSITLKYRVLILNNETTPAEIEKYYEQWAK
jgi:hypothetical protein